MTAKLALIWHLSPIRIYPDGSQPCRLWTAGREATCKIKADPATQSIPVIVLTAHGMAGDEKKALEAGCDDYDTKPVNFNRLLDKIGNLLVWCNE